MGKIGNGPCVDKGAFYVRLLVNHLLKAPLKSGANNYIHSDSKKWCGFRYASAAPLFAAGDVFR